MSPDKWFPTRFGRATAVASVLCIIGSGIFVVPMIELPERPSAWLLIENVDGQPERFVAQNDLPGRIVWEKNPSCGEPLPGTLFVDQINNGCRYARTVHCSEGYTAAFARGPLASRYLVCVSDTLDIDLGRQPSMAFEMGLAWMEVRYFGRALLALLWAAGIMAAVGAAVAGSAYTGREILLWVQKGAQNEKPPE
jgi:hypothetical protein